MLYKTVSSSLPLALPPRESLMNPDFLTLALYKLCTYLLLTVVLLLAECMQLVHGYFSYSGF